MEDRARQGGVAEALLREALREASSLGASRAVLVAAVQNQGAQRLFERIGFRPTMLEMTCELHGGNKADQEAAR